MASCDFMCTIHERCTGHALRSAELPAQLGQPVQTKKMTKARDRAVA